MPFRVSLVLFLSALCVLLLSGDALFARGGGPIGPPVSNPKPTIPGGGTPRVGDEDKKVEVERAAKDPADAIEENRQEHTEKVRDEVIRNCQERILKSLVDGMRKGLSLNVREVDGGGR